MISGTASGADVAIAYNRTTKIALISWRGTVSRRDWLEVSCRVPVFLTTPVRSAAAQVLSMLHLTEKFSCALAALLVVEVWNCPEAGPASVMFSLT